MKKDAYEDLIAEISKQLAEKILMEEGDLTRRVKTIDYGFRLSESTVDRVTKASALQAEAYLEQKLLEGKDRQGQTLESNGLSEELLVELDGCEIRTGIFAPAENGPGDEQPKRTKVVRWRDVRVGLARPMTSESKLYVAQMEKYPKVVSQLVCVAAMLGMARENRRRRRCRWWSRLA